MSFPCTGCGACCKRAGVNVMLLGLDELPEDHELYFPYGWDDTGRCEKLTDDNKCSVYENRPLICNIDKMHELLKMPKEEYYAENIAACNRMMDEDGVPQQFRI